MFQRTPNFVLPARNQPLNREELDEVKATYPERRANAKLTPGGSSTSGGTRNALEVSQEEREEAWEAAWQQGGTMIIRRFRTSWSATKLITC
ncbi:hypothetical protein [Arthrobacter sp. W4I7]|uniref:hypothetical protein n=1 Tax=Arthrobacter sp. W4I7 TaxID=3042296 RepID=UPI00277F799F|nr:hypothetical protein [Arthrobacter sp. W4I7]MDQ0691407.1 hypothetical protein [Arthrobacter sp. W4I7]